MENDHTRRQATLMVAVLTRQEMRSTKHIYAGTVSPAEVNKRRAANRVARKSRKANRRGGK